ncbi:hypothetical protein AB1Y20_012508 [Prymnesium parvum]|uniref:SIN1-type PH domain-containing protein n=1 Tax=Prymnesium parvum TaxID=97485 RepID=A0AB34IJ07_PRYPA
MEVSSVEALERAVRPHLQLHADRDANLELLHLLNASPESSCSASSYEGDSDDAGLDDSTIPENGCTHGAADGQPTRHPEGHLEAIREYSANQRKLKQPKAPAMPSRMPSRGPAPAKQQRVLFGKAGAERSAFQRKQPAGGEAKAVVSALSAAVQHLRKSDDIDAPPAAAGKLITIKVFGHMLPGNGPVSLNVSEKANMGYVVKTVLSRHTKGVDAEECTLLMAESDGEPEEGMPALRLDQPIGEFGQTTFALRKVAGGKKQGGAGDSEPSTTSAMWADKIRIYLPAESHGQRLKQRSIVHKVENEAIILADLLIVICKKEKVQLDPSKHVFRRALAEASTGETDELDMYSSLKSLKLSGGENGEPALVVAPRTYEDSPMPIPQQVRKESRSVLGEGEIEDASHIGDFIFSDQTAARYKEFMVVKVNKRGVRQDRVLGIDRERVYNKTRMDDDGETSFRNGLLKVAGLRQSAGGTKHPEFNMRDLLGVHIVTPSGAFAGVAVACRSGWGGVGWCERSKEVCCVFKDPEDPSKQKQYHYEAMSNHEAAEIVAKLDYLMQMQNQASIHNNSLRSQSAHDQPSCARNWAAPSNLGLGSMYLVNQRSVLAGSRVATQNI